MKTFLVIPGQNIPQHYADCVWCLHQSVVLSRRWLTQSPLLDGVLGGFIPLTGEQLCFFSRSILWRVPLLWGFGDDLQGFLFPPCSRAVHSPGRPEFIPAGLPKLRPRCGTGQGQGAGLRVLQPGEAALGFGGDAVLRDGGCGMGLTGSVRLQTPSDRCLCPPPPHRALPGSAAGLGAAHHPTTQPAHSRALAAPVSGDLATRSVFFCFFKCHKSSASKSLVRFQKSWF